MVGSVLSASCTKLCLWRRRRKENNMMGTTVCQGLPRWRSGKESESEVAQSCPTLSNPVDCSPPGSSIRGILQSRILKPRATARDSGATGSIPGLGRFPGGGHGNLLQYSLLENPMDRGIWWAIVHEVPKNQTGLSTHTLYVRYVSGIFDGMGYFINPNSCVHEGSGVISVVRD